MGDALGGVEHQQGDVGTVERPQRPHERVVLGALAASRAAAHPGGVDELDRPLVGLDQGVDGVAGRAGQVVHDGPLLAREAVEQGRLADVRAPDDGDGRGRRVRPSLRAPRRRRLGQSSSAVVAGLGQLA